MANKKEKPKKESKEKKEEKVSENDEVDNPVNQKHVMWFVLTLVVIGLLVFGGMWIVSASKEFEYIGLTFTKERFNDFFIYTVHLVGTNVNADPINFQLSLRHDPRTNDVPIERNIIVKDDRRPIYVALNMSSGLEECGSVPLVALGQFIDGLGYEPITTVTTVEASKEFDKIHSNCDNNSGSTVLMITTANKTEIVVNKGNSDCYEVRVNNCELSEALEKAELSILSELTRKPL